jgi:hypothetical protein
VNVWHLSDLPSFPLPTTFKSFFENLLAIQFLQVEERAAGLHPGLCGGDWAAPFRDQAAGGEGRHQWRRHESKRYHLGNVADLGCLSRIPDPYFSIPEPNFFQPRSRIRIKEFKYFNPKNGSKHSEI